MTAKGPSTSRRAASTAWQVPQGLARPSGTAYPAGRSVSSWKAYLTSMARLSRSPMAARKASSISRLTTKITVSKPARRAS